MAASSPRARAFKPVSHVIVDVDGLLLDTESMYAQAASEILTEFKHTHSLDLRAQTMGLSAVAAAEVFIQAFDLPLSPLDWLAREESRLSENWPSVPWLPGALKLVHHLFKCGVPVAAVSCRDAQSLALKTRDHSRMFEMFSHVVTSDEAQGTDLFSLCLSRFEPRVPTQDQCLVIEDSPVGVRAAVQAGMPCVMIPDAEFKDGIAPAEASLVLDNAHLFQPEMFGLPSFDYKPVTHVIFDMDGLLLDTNVYYNEVTAQILGEHGQASDETFKMESIGMRQKDLVPKMLEFYNLPYTEEAFISKYIKLLRDKLPQCQVKSGVWELVSHLEKHKIPMAVATSSSGGNFKKKVQNHGDLFSRFHHVVNGTDPDLDEGKPAPDIFLLCADRFEENKPDDYSSCLVFEDSPNGADAAQAAGMQCVLVPEWNEVTAEMTKSATQVLGSLDNFRPEDFGLHPF
ncbi:pseudouridine-5'-phosphatase-like [Tigriopus californicus]|uniref:pseudouridine-5'-phosphatase-like n=1 Tax=Tigriopus californicus TaxID=6832 RepID=UPI0027DA3BCB|nr:pseudouridine-5'-phosphatase-like [Tigriopus californicus]